MVGGEVAGEIAKYIGGLGEVTNAEGHLILPDADYFVILACQTLNCSALDLDAHPDKARWLRSAASYRIGTAEGEKLLKRNPKFWSMQKADWKKEEMARGK